MPDIRWRTRCDDDVLVVRLVRTDDAAEAVVNLVPGLAVEARRLGCRHVRIDLSGFASDSTAVLAAMVLAERRARRRGVTLAFIVDRRLYDAACIGRLDTILPIRDVVDAGPRPHPTRAAFTEAATPDPRRTAARAR